MLKDDEETQMIARNFYVLSVQVLPQMLKIKLVWLN